MSPAAMYARTAITAAALHQVRTAPIDSRQQANKFPATNVTKSLATTADARLGFCAKDRDLYEKTNNSGDVNIL